ncbi:hypothetical protein AVEN_116768-1 [Araneus ventricosus]|uniref:Uncharacterized protein n=1 Tax=Araneus ventricosus TaxID=182803 RepID=A0A4Y2D8V3_ARAVE|nr:hypothetical protein AVEN_116768-1 [Araneus ventricosus]
MFEISITSAYIYLPSAMHGIPSILEDSNHISNLACSYQNAKKQGLQQTLFLSYKKVKVFKEEVVTFPRSHVLIGPLILLAIKHDYYKAESMIQNHIELNSD